MLRLEKMEVWGFKSFGDRTEVRFPRGITAIVGPNGCGKSNIGDAINWVLGEQSPKMLRGRAMADVIFSGSAGRKPLGMAEVSLLFSGAEGLPLADDGSMAISRRIFRTGESEYRVNGKRTRLKDIQEMLRRGRVGTRTYATIEQGKIDQVLNAKPKDRRALIEDAAGIAGYKHKRRLAELKLEATQANLLRVNDIVVEVQRQINSLKRQAAKARRYRRLRDELRSAELVRFALQARTLDAELSRLRREEAAARDAEAEAAARLARIESDLVSRREALEAADAQFRAAAENVHALEIEIDRAETRIGACRERIEESNETASRQTTEARTLASRRDELLESCRVHREGLESSGGELSRIADELAREQASLEQAERRQATLRQEIESLRREQFEAVTRSTELSNRLRSIDETLTRIEAQRARVAADRAEAEEEGVRVRSEAEELVREAERHHELLNTRRAELERAERELTAARGRHSAAVEELAAAREAEKSARAKLDTLQDLETRFAGADGVKSLLTSGEASGIRVQGVVADYVEASREVEGAAESYLQAVLPTVILETDADAQRAVEFLRSRGDGRTSLISRSQPAGALAVGVSSNGSSPVPRQILEDRRVIGRLKEQLNMNPAGNGVAADRIGDAVLVDSLSSALELHRAFPGTDYLTPEGDVVYASGIISAGGRGKSDQGLLAHKRRLDEALREAGESADRIVSLERQVAAEREAVDRLEVEIVERRRGAEEAERREVELQLRVQRSGEETERAARRSAMLADEIGALQAEASRLMEARETITGDASRAEETRSELERGFLERTERVEGNESDVKRILVRVTDLRAEEAARRQKQESAEEEGRRLSEALNDLESRLRNLRQEASDARARADSNAELLAQTERDLAGHLERREAQATLAGRLEGEIAARRRELSQREGELVTVRGELESLREKTRDAELGRARAESDREHLDDLCRQELGIAVEEAAADEEATAEESDPEELAARIDEIRQKIDRIGPVNMTAIEEFSELEERNEFLTSQREDLEKSMESLRESIKRINRQSRQRFTEAFEAIRVGYQEVFKLLFSGGRADLRLEENEDVLECGIDILAQPPGKRLTGVHLLSGGEKALSAIALLFAIFRYQPSPFCLLDEVDAALDDANVGRFTRMVGEYAKNTQFVLITHNKLSMEVANLIYGVTMEERGVSKVMSLELS